MARNWPSRNALVSCDCKDLLQTCLNRSNVVHSFFRLHFFCKVYKYVFSITGEWFIRKLSWWTFVLSFTFTYFFVDLIFYFKRRCLFSFICFNSIFTIQLQCYWELKTLYTLQLVSSSAALFVSWPLRLLASSWVCLFISCTLFVSWPLLQLASSSAGLFVSWPLCQQASSSLGLFVSWSLRQYVSLSAGLFVGWPLLHLVSLSAGPFVSWSIFKLQFICYLASSSAGLFVSRSLFSWSLCQLASSSAGLFVSWPLCQLVSSSAGLFVSSSLLKLKFIC